MNKVIIPNSLPNISRSMRLGLKIDIDYFDTVTSEYVTISNREDGYRTQGVLDTQPSIEGGSEPVFIWFVPSNMGGAE